MKNVCLLTLNPVPKPGRGGPGAAVERLALGINRNSGTLGWRAKVISEVPSSKSITGLTNTVSNMLDKGFLPTQLRALLELYGMSHRISRYAQSLKNCLDDLARADIIHIHDIYAAAALSQVAPRILGAKPVLLSIHSSGATSEERLKGWPRGKDTRFGKSLTRLDFEAINSAKALVMPSSGALSLLEKDRPEIKGVKRSFILYNGVEIKPGQKDKIRGELGLHVSDFLVVAVGRLAWAKGIDILIEATKLACSTHPQVHTLIVGRGPEKPNLERLAYSMQVQDNVHFLGFRDDVPDILADADVLVSPGRVSAFDLTILEALAAGIPVIATDVGGNAEALGGGEAGLLIDRPDPELLAKGITFLIENPQHRMSLVQKGLALYNQHYTIDAMARSGISIYEEVIENSNLKE